MILVTGCAGFIGFHTSLKLLKKKYKLVGVDSLNKYYDQNLKKDRLKILLKYKNFKFIKGDLSSKTFVNKVFLKNKISYVVHLAAQAGVRYSLKKPENYLRNNIIAFFNIIEQSQKNNIKHLLYASSSSVYGNQKKSPLREDFNTDQPIQFYAATKKSNEVIANAFSALYKLKTTGLRFFTVYGPWGRPDMSLFIFTKKILEGKTIDIFNYGNHKRDFTYVDDIANAIEKLIFKKGNNLCNIFNIGNTKQVNLMDAVNQIEILLKTKAKKNFLPLQKGDIFDTKSSVQKLKKFISYKPKIDFNKGVKKFIEWYKKYYRVGNN